MGSYVAVKTYKSGSAQAKIKITMTYSEINSDDKHAISVSSLQGAYNGTSGSGTALQEAKAKRQNYIRQGVSVNIWYGGTKVASTTLTYNGSTWSCPVPAALSALTTVKTKSSQSKALLMQLGGEANSSTIIYVPAITSYTISYNAQGGSGTTTAQTKWYNESIVLRAALTKTNYVFYHWNTKTDNTGVSYGANTGYATNASLSLAAIWNPLIYFNANGGNLGSVSSNYTKTYNTAFSFPTAKPTRTDYSFKHWGSTSTSNTAVTSVASTDNTTHTFYAIWNPIIYFNANGGSLNSVSSSYTKNYGSNYTLPTSGPIKNNYIFKGWGTTSTTTPANKTSSVTDNTTHTFYAIWNPLIYFYGNQGLIENASTKTVEKTYGTNLSLSTITPVRTNYRLLGWATSPTGAVQYGPNISYTDNLTANLYAKWQQIYNPPTINIQQGYRSDSQGNPQDDGTYITVKVDWSVFDMTTVDNGTPLSPTITLECYNDSNTLISNATVSVQLSTSANSCSGTRVLISNNANLDSDQPYVAKVSIDDGTENEGHTKTASVEIPTAFYPIDILRGGKGVAFGGAATQQGLMDIIGYDILIHQDLFFDSIDNNQSMESTNYKLYAAINNLGWTSEVIE